MILKNYTSFKVVKNQALKLCIEKNQLCIFVKINNHKAIIINKSGEIDNYFTCKKIINLSSKSKIKNAIKK